jgi:hypothetical protein
MTQKRLFKVIFVNQGKIYEIFAKRVSQGNLYGFVEVEGIVFGKKSSVVLDPTEERLKNEFEGVRVTYVPLHAVIRIDEVEKPGIAKIVPVSGTTDNVVPYPGHFPSVVSPPKKGGQD